MFLISLPNIDRFSKFFTAAFCEKFVVKRLLNTLTASLHYLVKHKMGKTISICEYMNKSLELNFWPILYDSIVFLCLQTQKVYLKQNII